MGRGTGSTESGGKVVSASTGKPTLSLSDLMKPLGQQPTENQNSAFRVIPLAALLGSPPPEPAFVLDPFLPVGAVTLLSGHGGIGKSQLGLTLAAHCACGRDWAGLRMNGGRAAVVSFEDDEAVITRRLQKIIEHFGLPGAEVGANLRIIDATDSGPLLQGAGLGGITPNTGQLEELDAKVGTSALIVVDNASEAFAGDENVRWQVQGFMGLLRRFARKKNAAVLLLAHVDKASLYARRAPTHFSGSTAWHNASRSRLALFREGECVMLAHEKANYSRLGTPIVLRFTDQGVLAPCPVEAIPPSARPTDTTMDDHAVLLAVRDAERDENPIPVSTRGLDNGIGRLLKMPSCKGFARSGGRRRLKDALDRLEADQKIEQAEHTKASGKRGRIWRVRSPS